MEINFLIPISHAKCLGHVEHDCDSKAEEFGKLLSTELAKISQPTLFIGDINRKEVIDAQYMDLNRQETKLITDFRQKLRKKLYLLAINGAKKILSHEIQRIFIFVFDCHSFSKKSKNFKTEKVPNPEVVLIFNNQKYFRKFLELYEDLSKQLATNIFAGDKNDIINEMSDITNYYELDKYRIYVIPILIEVLEDIEKEKYNLATKIIHNWVLKVTR